MTEPVENLKPKGKKAPMHLVPWDVVVLTKIAPQAIQRVAIREVLLPYGKEFLHGEVSPLVKLFLESTLRMMAPDFYVGEGKPPGEPWAEVARAFEYGALKYAPDNWRQIEFTEDTRREYWNAFVRHACEAEYGDGRDAESGCLHLAHCMCCLLILAYHEVCE